MVPLAADEPPLPCGAGQVGPLGAEGGRGSPNAAPPGTASKISHRDEEAAALRASEERFRALFNSIDAGYAVHELIFDANGSAIDARYLLVNPAFARHSGIADAEGRTVRELLPNLEPMWLETYGAVALTGKPVRMERHSESMQRWFDIHAFRLGDPQLRQVAVLFKDITKRKQTEQALIAAKAEADSANRAKSDFLLSMSHELRSPLSTMLGFAQLIEAGTPAPTPAQQSSVEQILKAGWYLLGLINEILDLTTIESGRLLLSPQDLLLNEVLDDCRVMVEPQAQGAGIELRFPVLGQACRVQADATRTKQVLLNLLTNAIKYNRSAGRVEVRCTAAPGQRVRISVEDTGPGLSAAQVAHLFEPFNRLGQESTGVSGTGIGLVISRRLVELMGGSIGVESTVGVGSCFWFELDEVPAVAAIGLPEHTLLCVESDALCLQEVAELVAQCPGVCLLRARDLHSGVEMARSARPHAILLCTGLADAFAADAVRSLAQDPATAHIPVIALDCSAEPRPAEPSPAAGFFGHLTQPVRSEAFAHTLGLAFQRNPAGGRHATTEETL